MLNLFACLLVVVLFLFKPQIAFALKYLSIFTYSFFLVFKFLNLSILLLQKLVWFHLNRIVHAGINKKGKVQHYFHDDVTKESQQPNMTFLCSSNIARAGHAI